VKEFEADTNLRLCLIVDSSGSMNFTPPKTLARPQPISRLQYAKQLASTLAYLAAHQGDAVGLWQVASKRVEMPAKRGAIHLGLVLDALKDLQAGGTTHLVESLHDAAEKISQRALVVIVSDFFAPPEELKPAIQHLRFKKHDVTAFHILDQQEIDFDFDRPARFVDLEGAEPVLADPSDIAIRYREALQQYLSAMDELVRSTGLDYHRVKLHEPYDEVLAKFLLSRTPKKGN
jgi:uncharacterized protein (DUF58 family)